jgi:NAD(P)-dependent dehydrogenase (short-subunit alcohol dehydrogenase family)
VNRRSSQSVIDQVLELAIAPSWSRVGYDIRRRMFDWDASALPRLEGRVVVLTGFTSGIGRATASMLGSLGATLHLVGRDPGRVASVSAELLADGIEVTTSIADLSDLDAVRRIATEIIEQHPSIDVLIHNAGALSRTYTTSAQGYETTVAAQVLGPFLLTTLLLEPLRAAHGRVLTVASGGMYAERLSVADLEMTPDAYDGVRAYARAKRAQVELTREWTRRNDDTVSFHTMHPGWADTPGVVESLPTFHRITRPLLRDPAAGADTLVWLAAIEASDLGESGGFWLDRRRRSISKVPWTDTPAGERYRLWSWCMERTGLS